MQLPGTPSDDVDEVLATGRADVTTVFVSMSLATPRDDAEYLQWHTLDHRPEQPRLARSVRRYDWSRRRHAVRHGRRATSATKPSTT